MSQRKINHVKIPEGYTLEEREIIRGNHFIAFFVGLEQKEWSACFQPVTFYMEGDFLKQIHRAPHPDLLSRDNRCTELFFHISWDWFIPAFDYFRRLIIDDKILAHEKEHRVADILSSIQANDIGNSFTKLVKHIKWHNRAVKDESEED